MADTDLSLIAHGVAIVCLICCSAFFSGSETALTSASKGRLKSMSEKGNRGAKRALGVTADPDRLLSGILLGNNFVNILATALATSLFSQILGDSGVLFATLVMTVLVLVFAEILPKTYALTWPEASATVVAGPIRTFITLFAPIVFVARAPVRALLASLGGRRKKRESTQDIQEEVVGRMSLGVSEGMYSPEDLRRVLGALDIHNRTVENVMQHRSTIKMLNADDPLDSIFAQCIDVTHSRLPVYKGDLENIIKIAHVRDIYRLYHHQKTTGQIRADWVQGLKDPYFIPETTSLGAQMREFLARHAHFALVVDEYGALQGLVTLEDILEEIVGEIADEYDAAPTDDLLEAGSKEMVVDGTLPVHDLNKTMNWDLPEDNANTVAGLIINEIRYIPDQGETFHLHGHEFIIEERIQNRIARIRIRSVGRESG
ncbi:MAG: CNNM domain-containing protein [Rhodobacteraceae bacterium]|nr:CNNM domain-containing protein [Paracoccaceae bacterium]